MANSYSKLKNLLMEYENFLAQLEKTCDDKSFMGLIKVAHIKEGIKSFKSSRRIKWRNK